jgi:hypothetical protein
VAEVGCGGAAAVVVGVVVDAVLVAAVVVGVLVAAVVVGAVVGAVVVDGLGFESTTSFTSLFRGTSVPSCGFCEMIVPFGAFDGWKTSFGFNPTWPARTSASCSFIPTKRGTATFGGTVVDGAVVITVVVFAFLSLLWVSR